MISPVSSTLADLIGDIEQVAFEGVADAELRDERAAHVGVGRQIGKDPHIGANLVTHLVGGLLPVGMVRRFLP